MNITKEQFDKFLTLQNSGIINMTDIVMGSKLIKETQEVYKEIMFNYSKLKKEFYEKN
jgi:hypothetical protein